MEVKKERIRLETLEIPDIPEDDIVEVITNVKELLQKRAVKKYESSILKSLRELLYVHGWKSIVLQGGLTLLVALAVWPVSYTHLDVYKRQLFEPSGGQK